MDITRNIVIPSICSFVACCAFGIQFNIRFKHLIAASVGSLVSQLISSLMGMQGFDEIKCCFVAAAAVAVYSEAMARFFKAPVNMYLIVGIIPLVPGGLMFYTMLALVMGDNQTFLERAAEALGTAGAIAMGVFAASAVIRLIIDIYRGASSHYKNKNMKKEYKEIKKI